MTHEDVVANGAIFWLLVKLDSFSLAVDAINTVMPVRGFGAFIICAGGGGSGGAGGGLGSIIASLHG